MKYVPRRPSANPSPVWIVRLLSVIFIAITPLIVSAQHPWRSIGPFGGDARSFAAVPGEPQHLYLGDIDNWVFESYDGGANWTRLSRVGGSDEQGEAANLIVDSIVVGSLVR